MGHEAVQAGEGVAHEAAEQGKHLASETRQQASGLVREASSKARSQAQQQQKRAADSLRALGTELRSMADSDHGGPGSQVVRRGADVAEQAAGWLDARQPGDLVREVREYASRHPGTFLAGAAIAGLLAGRLTRALGSGSGHDGHEGHGGHGGHGAGRVSGEVPAGQPGVPVVTPLHAPPSPTTATAVPSPTTATTVRHGPTGTEVGP
ncbi:hypothetical protein [Micromonospora nigra]|uniref:hypothetical protein n=1 Tax=Micromonospora nigra TaxID=145857 RepID=UPI001112E39E|nr:hypothetical protein [Micromonospora nigra]